jgi:glutathione synthase/RimK-type ligase-like ATP-grasp enzyme
MPGTVVKELKSRGHEVEIVNPDTGYLSVEQGVFVDKDHLDHRLSKYDLIVSRNRNPLGLVLLCYCEGLGIPTVNTHASIQKVRDKASMAISLKAAGIETASTILADDVVSLSENITNNYPIIIKATYGDNCQGLRLILNEEELAQVNQSDALLLAQRYYSNDGYDLKLYVCGEFVFAVRKPSPFSGDSTAPMLPVTLTSELQSLAYRCGEIFGLDLYGVDCIETGDGPIVIEVNDFPNYSGIQGVAELIVDHILSCG